MLIEHAGGVNVKYPIKQLAEYSGVSTRTLRYYDEIGLLAPASYGDSGYRYYGEKELLLLQQILFFRELGFHLKEIKQIVCADEFDQLSALEAHKMHLIEKINTLKNLTKTIDKTVNHLKGEIDMKNKEYELFKDFENPKQKEFVDYLKKNTDEDIDDLMLQIQESAQKISKDEHEKMQDQTNEWADSLKRCINDGKSPLSKEVQDIIAHFVNRYQRLCSPTWPQVIALVKAEVKHPGCQEHFRSIHPEFCEFYLKAVINYAESKLKEEE